MNAINIQVITSFINHAPEIPDWFQHQTLAGKPQKPVDKNAPRLEGMRLAAVDARAKWTKAADAHRLDCQRKGVEWTTDDGHLPIVALEEAYNQAQAEYDEAYLLDAKEYEPLYAAYTEAKDKWEAENRMARIVQWRMYYAKSMFAEFTRFANELVATV